MKQVLVLGAGKSSPYLITKLLDLAQECDWFVTVGDLDDELAKERVDGHTRGAGVQFNVNDSHLRERLIRNADLVVNMMAPRFLSLIAGDCVHFGKHMLSVSYRDEAMRELENDAQRAGVLLLCELGLDPGIDHMSAMSLIHRIRGEGGRIQGFCSYGSGVSSHNNPSHYPMRYVITWNPRNVVMAGERGSQYMEHGQIKIVPYHHVFHHTWQVEVPGVGILEAYPNRDSLSYMQHFGLEHVTTMIRGTLRWPGWSETWAQIVKLGLPNENVRIPGLAKRSYREVVEMFLPLNVSGPKIESRIARFLQISPTGQIMENMRWLGLLSDEPTGCKGDTAADMMSEVMERKLALTPELKDLVILMHELEVKYPGMNRPDEKITSTMAVEGDAGGFTAMAKTVGLPAALAAKLVLCGELHLTGAQIPTHPSIYEPILKEIADEGLVFEEQLKPLN